MLKLAVDEFKELGIEISTWEIDQNRISYTIHTLQHFKDAGVKTVFVIGADAFCDIASWKDYRKLFELSDFAVVNRPTHDNLQPTEMIPPTVHHFFKLDQAAAPSPDSTTFRHTSGSLLHFVPMTAFSMSSTTLRQRLRAGKDCSAFIPERALAYILEHGLYALQESSVPA
jgi:nicotinate-nucleotide adenylyltransferase